MSRELHLFILWERARYAQEKILEHIRSNFTIVKIYDILWSPDKVASDFSRFYGTNLPDKSYKEKECGKGRFLLIVVYDENPEYDKRWTSKGKQTVNIHMFDAKSLYREWTAGGHKVHATNSEYETNHDITLLLGMNISDFKSHIVPSDTIEPIQKDIVGADGWESVTQLFYVLNNCTDYVVLRNWECLPEQYTLEEHGDVDILVYNREDASLVLNGNKIHKDSKRVAYNVLINNQIVPFDIRHVGDNYYCSQWEYILLDSVVKYNNLVKVLDEENHLYTLLYHGLIHKWEIKDDYVQTILRLSAKLGIDIKNDFSNAVNVLVKYMQSKGYEFIKPNDDSVIWNVEYKEVAAYINRFNGTLCSYNAYPCSHVWYISKVFKCENSYIKVGNQNNVFNESQCLTKLQKYDCFQKLISFGERNGEFYLETSPIEGVSMSQYFHKYQNLNRRKLMNYVLQCLDIFRILHNEYIQHRDIAPDQFLISQSDKVYLIDFGWAKQLDCANSLIITPPSVCGAQYKIYGDDTTDLQMFAQMLKSWFRDMPYLRPVVKLIMSEEDEIELRTEAEKLLSKQSFTLTDYYIIFGKSLNKYLISKTGTILTLGKKVLRKIKRMIKNRIC